MVPSDCYPGLAMLLFLAAAAGGILLVVSILVSDIRPKNKVKASRG
jgi:hypothetical protein